MAKFDVKQQICQIGKSMYDSGFVAANDGNISVKLSEQEIIITPAGVSKGFMTPGMLITVDVDGNILATSGDWQPSSEMKMHLRVYKERPDVQAVVHAHPPYATTFAVAHIPLTMPLIAEAIVNLGCVPVAEYATPSTNEVPDSVAQYLENFDAVLLANHGALAWGSNLLNAYHKLESVEFYAKLTFLSLQLGSPKQLSSGQVDTLYKIRKDMNISGRHPGNICGTQCSLPCSRNKKKI
ncbi:5-deoxy-D-ribulose 1-phosphate aldolase [Sporomusa carbonis]|uniref:class II aldolase/adducin family protein n=1 Tax=Sporomusa carbonis TaxID=3076075 RepID=UPI003A728172